MLTEEVFKVGGAAAPRSWGGTGMNVLEAWHRASVVGAESASHGFSLFWQRLCAPGQTSLGSHGMAREPSCLH